MRSLADNAEYLTRTRFCATAKGRKHFEDEANDQQLFIDLIIREI